MPAFDLSIVTPVLNGAAHIQACVRSTRALADGGLRVEHIIVDGGSSDATLALLADLGSASVLERPGTGAHEACAIGVAAARGAHIALLMADDVWAPGAAAAFAAALAAPGWDMALFAAELVGAEARTLSPPQRLWDVLRHYPGLNSALLSAELARRLSFNVGYPAVHDRLLMVDAFAASRCVRYSDEVVVRLSAHAGSLTMSPSRDVMALKGELNALASALAHAPQRQPAHDVMMLWQAHTALSLVIDPLLAQLRGERRQSGGAAPVRAMFPAVNEWPAAGGGFVALLAARDRFVPASNNGENLPCRDVGLAAPV